MRSKRTLLLLIFAISLLLFTGCSRDYTIEVKYVTELDPTAISNLRSQNKDTSITVAQFADSRNTVGVAGAKNPIGNVAIPYNSTKPVSDIVRDTLADVFKEAGFKVETMGLWNLQPETVKDIATTLAMGGEIKVFWAENRPDPSGIGGSGFSNVRILFVLSHPATEKIIWQGEIEGGVTRSGFFSTPKLQEMLEAAFAQVIDRLITNADFIRALGSI